MKKNVKFISVLLVFMVIIFSTACNHIPLYLKKSSPEFKRILPISPSVEEIILGLAEPENIVAITSYQKETTNPILKEKVGKIKNIISPHLIIRSCFTVISLCFAIWIIVVPLSAGVSDKVFSVAHTRQDGSFERFAKMYENYEAEQKTLESRVAELRSQIASQQESNINVDTFITKVRKYTDVPELTPEIIREFIDRIEIYKPERMNGHKIQRMRLLWNCIGEFMPPT